MKLDKGKEQLLSQLGGLVSFPLNAWVVVLTGTFLRKYHMGINHNPYELSLFFYLLLSEIYLFLYRISERKNKSLSITVYLVKLGLSFVCWLPLFQSEAKYLLLFLATYEVYQLALVYFQKKNKTSLLFSYGIGAIYKGAILPLILTIKIPFVLQLNDILRTLPAIMIFFIVSYTGYIFFNHKAKYRWEINYLFIAIGLLMLSLFLTNTAWYLIILALFLSIGVIFLDHYLQNINIGLQELTLSLTTLVLVLIFI